MNAGGAPQQVLAAFAQLGQQLGAILDTALDVEPAGGLSDEWSAQLRRLGVAALDEEVRYDAAQAAAQVKGAPIAEVATCLQAAVGGAFQALAALAAGVGLRADQVRQLGATLKAMAEAAERQYRAEAPARKTGMFAPARAAAQKHSWDSFGKGQGYVLKCGGCGAPRINADLTCAFCGSRI